MPKSNSEEAKTKLFILVTEAMFIIVTVSKMEKKNPKRKQNSVWVKKNCLKNGQIDVYLLCFFFRK